MSVDEKQIRTLVQEVLSKLQTGGLEDGRPLLQPDPGLSASADGGEDGVFETVDMAANAAEKAFYALHDVSLATRGKIIQALRDTALRYKEDFAKRTMDETGMGRVEDKIQKFVSLAALTPGLEDLQTEAWSGDRGLTIQERAPFGVIGAVTPSTHPLPTMFNNAISCVASGNTAVFNGHPAGKRVFVYGLQIANRAIVEAGGPPNLVTCVRTPTIESADAMFKHPKVKLLLITGGPGVVKAALASPKRAICAGPGNSPVVVDETADLARAARSIVDGGSFDNNLLCIAEKEVFVVDSVFDALMAEMLKLPCHLLNGQQIEALTKKAFCQEGAGCAAPNLNRDFVGRNAEVLAAAIGLAIDPATRLLIGETHAEHHFVMEEQLMPFIPFVRCRNFDEAIERALRAERGFHHTAIIHSINIENMSKMARLVDTTLFIKNGPCTAGLGGGGEGYTSFSIAGATGEGIVTARTLTRMRRCTLVDYFRII